MPRDVGDLVPLLAELLDVVLSERTDPGIDRPPGLLDRHGLRDGDEGNVL
jgi:hypothetical protein